jgi:hypothetical protein
MCPCGWDLWWVIVNVIRVLGWVCELTMTWVGLCNMSLGLWCAGVELGGGGRRRGEGQVGTCRADGPGAVNDGREAWTEGPGGRVTSCSGWHLGTSTSASVHGGVTMLTESRRRSSESSRALVDLAAGRSRTAVTRVELWGTRMEYATHGSLVGWASKPPGDGFAGLASKPGQRFRRGTGAARGKIMKVMSRRSKFVKEAGPSNRLKNSWTIAPSGKRFDLKISRDKTEIV